MDGVYKYSIEPKLAEYAALAFEDVCRQFVRELQKAELLPFRYARMGRWTGKTTVRDDKDAEGLRQAETEIDIVAVSRGLKKYLVGECKFKMRPFSYSEYLDTIAKLSNLKTKSEFFYALFSASGFDEKIKEFEGKNLYLYELKDIVSGVKK